MPHLRRFFADRVSGGMVMFSGGEANHIYRVLRKREGDELVAVFGGIEYVCKITKSNESIVEAEIKSSTPCSADPSRHIFLYMACCKADKMELIAQKAVELGASAFVPFIAKRCERVPADPEKFCNRIEKIAREATKQCGRSDTITVERPISFDELIERIPDHEAVIFAYEESTGDLKEALQTTAYDIALVIGCEGGFDPAEADKIIAAGGISVSLGRRILRAETAAIALVSLLNYETGN